MIFNVGGYEILVIAIVALIAVGPEQLPSVMRKVGRTASQLRGMASGMRDEFMSGMNEMTDLVDADSWLGSGADDDPIVPRGYADRQRDGKALPSTSTSTSTSTGGAANGRAAGGDGDTSPTPSEASKASGASGASGASPAAGTTTGRQGGDVDEDDEDDEDDEIHTVVTMPSGDLFTPDDDPSEPDDAAGDPGETAGSNGSRA